MIFEGGLSSASSFHALRVREERQSLKGKEKEKKRRGGGGGGDCGAHTKAVHSLCSRLSLSRSVPVQRMVWQFPVNGVAVSCKTSPNQITWNSRLMAWALTSTGMFCLYGIIYMYICEC